MAGITLASLLTEIQYHLLEEVNSGLSYSSGQWTVSEVFEYFTNRQNQFLKDTAILLKRTTINYTPLYLRQPLPDDWVITQRVVWQTYPNNGNTMTIDEFARIAAVGIDEADSFRIVSFGFGAASGVQFGAYKELPRSDTWDADYGDPSWSSTGALLPLVYMDEETPSLVLQIAPVPVVTGGVEILYVYKAPNILTDGFVVPDEFLGAIKYGVLADMLSKVGRGQDLIRAAYCESRYQEGVEAAKIILAGWQGG